MPYEQSRRFLNAFSEIEKALRRIASARRGDRFYSVVRKCESLEKVVKQYSDDLKEFADLRNAIVHERCGDEPIAEPHAETVRRIERIRDLLTAPPTVDPSFLGTVHCCSPDDRVSEAAVAMLKYSFSQIPICQAGECLGLLTSETIARWLGQRFEQTGGPVEDESVQEVAKLAEYDDNYVIVPKSTTLFDVLDHFDSFTRRGRNLDALLITASGNRTEPILGIITVFDLPPIYRSITV